MQKGDLINKRRKLDVIDEYARVTRYSNDGVIWTSGVNLNSEDIKNNVKHWSMIGSKNEKVYKNSTGVKNNNFINFFSNDYYYNENYNPAKIGLNKEYINFENNKYSFTEDEKQEIYLMNNNVMPYNFVILCNDIFEINRPNYSKSCKKEFILKKENIYIDQSGNFLTVCPNCGTINYVLKESLDEKTIRYIIENHNEYDEKINYNNSENIILKRKSLKKGGF